MASSYSPTPERELALALVGTEARRTQSKSQIEALAAQVDYVEFEALLRENGMLSLIGHRLLDFTDSVPASFRAAVDEYVGLAQREGIAQQMITIRLLAALGDAGIKALPLKGPLLGERIYRAIDERVSADIDLLVSETELARAREVIEGFGYSHALTENLQRHKRRPSLHEVLRSSGGLPELELHWRTHWNELNFSDALLANATPGPDGYLLPRPVDELAELLLFYARDGFAGIRLLGDIAAWWDRYGETLSLEEVSEVTKRHPEIAPTLATSAIVAERFCGLPAHRLFDQATLAEASQSAMHLANWSLRGRSGQIVANVSFIDLLLTPGGKRRELIHRHLWPSEDFLYLRWSEIGDNGLRLRARWIAHLFFDCGRYVIASWHVWRSRDWAAAPRWLDNMPPNGA